MFYILCYVALIIMEYKHIKSGRIYNVISMDVINATNKDDGIVMVLYEGMKRDGNGVAKFVREYCKTLYILI